MIARLRAWLRERRQKRLVAKARPFPPAIRTRRGGLSYETQRQVLNVELHRDKTSGL